MSIVKKEARLSGMLLARKGTAKPAHIDHHLNVQVMDQFKQSSEQKRPAVAVTEKQIPASSDRLAEAVKEINELTKRQYNKIVTSVAEKPQAIEKEKEPEMVKVSKEEKASKKEEVVSSEPAPATKRIAMTLRMEQEEHLKLKIFAAHSRKSCQEVISAALEKYLCQSEKLCNMSDCNCLK